MSSWRRSLGVGRWQPPFYPKERRLSFPDIISVAGKRAARARARTPTRNLGGPPPPREIPVRDLGGQPLPIEISIRDLGGRRLPNEISDRGLRGQPLPCEILIQDLEGQPLPLEISDRDLGGRRLTSEGALWNFGGPPLPSEIRDLRINGRDSRINGRYPRIEGRPARRRGPARRAPGLSSNPRRRDKNRTGAPGRTACTSAPPDAGRNWGRCASPRPARRCGRERRRAGDRGAVAWRHGRGTPGARQGVAEPT